jgi:predicted alpha/beta superfamily hydrolase
MTESSLGPWLEYAAYRAGAPHTVTGTVVVQPGVYSPQLDNRRDVLVYLPPTYAARDRTYPVIYMQDGQNLFDADTAFGRQEWHVDETLEALSAEGLEAIVVGLPHMDAARLTEYNPFPVRGGRGEQYLDFIVETVKPIIDNCFRTQPERESTVLAGSSMGGLISFYGYFRHPLTFGAAIAMSPAFWYAGRALYQYVAEAPFLPGWLYLDRGTTERGGERRMAQHLRTLGYGGEALLRYVEEAGGEHNEAAWARRLPEALRFVLQP